MIAITTSTMSSPSSSSRFSPPRERTLLSQKSVQEKVLSPILDPIKKSRNDGVSVPKGWQKDSQLASSSVLLSSEGKTTTKPIVLPTCPTPSSNSTSFESNFPSAIHGDTTNDIGDVTKEVLITTVPSQVSAPPVVGIASSSLLSSGNYPLGVNKSTERMGVIKAGCKLAYETWKNESLILEGSDIVKILDALSLVKEDALEELNAAARGGSKEEEMVGDRDNGKQPMGVTFSIPLTGNLKLLSRSMDNAWSSLEQRIAEGGTGQQKSRFPRKRRRVPLDAAKTIRKYLLTLMRIPEDALSVILNNVGVMKYSSKLAFDFLVKMGVTPSIIPDFSDVGGGGTTDIVNSHSVISCCKKCLDVIQSSLLRRRVLVAIDVLTYVAQWENAVEYEHHRELEKEKSGPFGAVVENLRRSVSELRAELNFKVEKIAYLETEVERLRQIKAPNNKRKDSASSNTTKSGVRRRASHSRQETGNPNYTMSTLSFDSINVQQRQPPPSTIWRFEDDINERPRSAQHHTYELARPKSAQTLRNTPRSQQSAGLYLADNDADFASSSRVSQQQPSKKNNKIKMASSSYLTSHKSNKVNTVQIQFTSNSRTTKSFSKKSETISVSIPSQRKKPTNNKQQQSLSRRPESAPSGRKKYNNHNLSSTTTTTHTRRRPSKMAWDCYEDDNHHRNDNNYAQDENARPLTSPATATAPPMKIRDIDIGLQPPSASSDIDVVRDWIMHPHNKQAQQQQQQQQQYPPSSSPTAARRQNNNKKHRRHYPQNGDNAQKEFENYCDDDDLELQLRDIERDAANSGARLNQLLARLRLTTTSTKDNNNSSSIATGKVQLGGATRDKRRVIR